MIKIKTNFALLLSFILISAPFNNIFSQEDPIAVSVEYKEYKELRDAAVTNKINAKTETLQKDDFEIVVSSFENKGVKTIIITRNQGGVFYDRTEWVGKGAIPDELNWLMGKGEPTLKRKQLAKAFFGVIIKASPNGDGVVVKEVVSNGPASKRGIMRGDRIATLNGKKLKSTNDFAQFLSTKKAGEKLVCRLYKGNRLGIEKIYLEKVPSTTELNVEEIDGGPVYEIPAPVTAAVQKNTPKNTFPEAKGGKTMKPQKSDMSLSNFEAFVTPTGDWLNISFNAPAVPLTMLVFDKDEKEVFHQHFPWFKGNFKQLVKLNKGTESPFKLVVAQGASVYSKVLEAKE